MDFDDAIEYAARELRHGATRPRVRRELVDMGMTPEEASKALNVAGQITGAQRNAAASIVARWQRIGGALIAVGGVAVAVWSYQAAEPGQYFIVPTGLIVAGVFLFLRGMLRA